MKELICITCPKGCHLKVDEETFAVTGNACPRGAEYGANELRNPVRVVTSTVIVDAGTSIARPQTDDAEQRTSDACPYETTARALPRRLPVKTDRPIPKGRIVDVMAEIARVRVRAPVALGQVLIPGVAGTEANIVATKALPD